MLERLEPRRGPLLEALGAEIEAQRGVRIEVTDWDLARLPAYLKMTFSVEDEQGRVLAAGQDLGALREQVRPKLRAALAVATRKLERTGQTSWTFGTIPKAVALPGRARPCAPTCRWSTRARPWACGPWRASRRSGCTCGTGMRRLLALTIPSPVRAYQNKLGNQAALALMEAPHASVRARCWRTRRRRRSRR